MKYLALIVTIVGLTISYPKIAQAQSETDDLGARLTLPTFQTRLSIGFNYDLLQSPTDVSFEYPEGFYGFNFPLQQDFNIRDVASLIEPAVDTIFNDSNMFSNSSNFRPKAGLRQIPNYTFRVSVPMLGGVATFQNNQNFFLRYQAELGNPNLFVDPKTMPDGVNFLLRGTLNVPVDLAMGWETMTFGYAYKFAKDIVVAYNLHRHIFFMDLQAKVDADMLGSVKVDLSSGSENSGDIGLSTIKKEFDYSSDRLNGRISGNYEGEAWTQTIGLKLWRMSLTSRFGMDIKAKGEFTARYSLPSFIDPEKFELKVNVDDPDSIIAQRNILLSGGIDSVSYTTNKIVNGKKVPTDLHWKMPQGHTFTLEVIPEHFKLSYTKIIGDIEMNLDQIKKEKHAIEENTERGVLLDSIKIDAAISVDHIIMMHVNLYNSFLNFGVFSFDIGYDGKENLIGKSVNKELRLDKGMMLPVLNVGSAIGTKLQLLLELDILPLPAAKTGVFYYF